MARLLEGYGQADDDSARWPENVPSLQAALVILDDEHTKIIDLLQTLIDDKIEALIRVLERPSNRASSGDQAGGEGYSYRRDAVAEIAEYGRPAILPRAAYGPRRRA